MYWTAICSPAGSGQRGEVFISGPQVARGYVGRPAETAERFVPCPFSKRPGARMYRTGDLARLTADGSLELAGRTDQQIKLRGYRIEPGEVESVIEAHPQVRQAAVVARAGPQGGTQLVAFVVPQRANLETIAGHRRQVLPNGLAPVSQNQNETKYVYGEIFERLTYLQHGITLPDDAVVLDIGANIGMFTSFVGQYGKNCRIFAFEPIAETAEFLRINAELYGGNAKVFQQGVSDKPGRSGLRILSTPDMMSGMSAYAAPEVEAEVVRRYLDNAGASSGQEAALADAADEILDGHFESRQQVCQLTTVSYIVRREGLDRIDLLKIDVQRAEIEVLNGIDDEHWPLVRQVALELHDPDGNVESGRLAEIRALLAEHGFPVRRRARHDAGRHRPVEPLRNARSRCQKPRTPAVLDLPNQILTADAVQAHLAEHLPDFLRPNEVILLPKLPQTHTNKVDRPGAFGYGSRRHAAGSQVDCSGNALGTGHRRDLGRGFRTRSCIGRRRFLPAWRTFLAGHDGRVAPAGTAWRQAPDTDLLRLSHCAGACDRGRPSAGRATGRPTRAGDRCNERS